MSGVPGGTAQPGPDPIAQDSAGQVSPGRDQPGQDHRRDVSVPGATEPGQVAAGAGDLGLAADAGAAESNSSPTGLSGATGAAGGPGAHPPDPSQAFSADRVVEDAATAQDRRRYRTAPLLQWPLMIVLTGLLVSLIIVATDHFRRGSVLFAACVVGAFVLRLVLPDRDAGWLAVRSRSVDLMVLGALGASLTVFALIVPPPS